MRKVLHVLVTLLIISVFSSCKEDPETLNNAPEVFSFEAEEVKRTSAVLTGHIVSTDKSNIRKYGFLISSTSDLSSSDTREVEVEGPLSNFSAQVVDLEIGEPYFYAAYASNGIDRMLSTVRAFTTPTRSGVLLSDLKMVDETTATFSARIADTGGGEIISTGFCWGEMEKPTIFSGEHAFATLDGSNNFAASLTLEAGKTYFVRAFAESNITGDDASTISYSQSISILLSEDPQIPSGELIWGLCGSMTEWGGYDDIPLYLDKSRNMFLAENVRLTEQDHFRVRSYGSWDQNYGLATTTRATTSMIDARLPLDLEGNDLGPEAAGIFDIWFDAEEKYLYIMTNGKTPEEAEEYFVRTPETWKIYYTSTDDAVVEPNDATVFGANIVSNTYENGQGVITFDGEVTLIGERAFYQSNRLKTIAIPDKVALIGEWAFADCPWLTSLSIPEGVTSIGEGAFRISGRIESITIPDSVVSIGQDAFFDCRGLTAFYGKYASEDNRCLVVDGVLIAFARDGLTSYSIPNGVTTIGENAFYTCDRLTSIAIPDSATAIGISAFYSCNSLTSVTIPDGVAAIGELAFYLCSGLTSVYCMPTTPPTGYANMFDNNASDRKIYVPNGSVTAYRAAEGWSDYADQIFPMDGEEEVPETWKIYYTSTDGKVVEPQNMLGENSIENFGANIVSNTYADGQGVITFDGPVTVVGYKVFMDCENLSTITIPESVYEIGIEAFYGCANLVGITIPEAVTVIESGAFQDCSSLETVTTGGDLRWAFGAFIGCDKLHAFYGPLASEDGRALILNEAMVAFAPYGLTSYSIPESVTVLGSHLFYGCDNITSITIPSKVTMIYDVAMYGCANLESVYCYPATPPGGGEMFLHSSPGAKIYVPSGSVEVYKIDPDWSVYADSIYPMDGEEEVPETRKIYYTTTDGNIVEFSDEAMYVPVVSNTYENGRGTIVLESDIVSIHFNAFKNRKTLQSVILPEGLTTIEHSVFSGCSSLEEVVIPAGVKLIDGGAFSDCTMLTHLSLPEGLETLMGGCFNFSGIVSLTIPDSVTDIGANLFAGCRMLESVSFPDTITTIGSQTFDGCENLSEVKLGEHIELIDWFAFKDCRALRHITLPGSLKELGMGAFTECHALESIVIPNSVTTIAEGAFKNCSKLTSVTLSENIDAVKSSTFFGCGSLKSVIVPEGVTILEAGAFYGCSSMESVSLPSTLEYIGAGTFFSCEGLSVVTVPASVHTIEERAFDVCSNITALYCLPETPPTALMVNESSTNWHFVTNFFREIPSALAIYVPAESVEAYKAAGGWNEYADRIYPME